MIFSPISSLSFWRQKNRKNIFSTKGQKISEAIYGILNSPKTNKKPEKFDLNSTMISQVDFFCPFFGINEDTIN
jgi:hypothetical protein